MAQPPRCLVAQLDEHVLVVDRASRHHLERVLRLRRGDAFLAVDGRGGKVLARWNGGDPAPVEQRWPVEPPPASPVWLAVASPRPARLDWLAEKATELGVDRLLPLRTQHAVREPGFERLQRLQRLADEALLQCGRLHRLVVEPPGELAVVLEQGGGAARWLARAPQAGEPAPPLPSQRPAGPLLLLVGPEGGFSPAEHALLEQRAAVPVGIGPHVLRVETAALALATLALVTPVAP